jgi:hypothetical protein
MIRLMDDIYLINPKICYLGIGISPCVIVQKISKAKKKIMSN